MRELFSELLYKEMNSNSKITVLLGDVGYGVFDKLKTDFPKRILNCGSSEQLMIGMASGMALSKNIIPVVYSITPFILFRPFEFIRNLVNHDRIPIKIVGSGRDQDYKTLGFTHYANDDIIIKENFKNIKFFKPDSLDSFLFTKFLYDEGPSYLNLKR